MMHRISESFVELSKLFYECTGSDGALVCGVLGNVDIQGTEG